MHTHCKHTGARSAEGELLHATLYMSRECGFASLYTQLTHLRAVSKARTMKYVLVLWNRVTKRKQGHRGSMDGNENPTSDVLLRVCPFQ